MMNPTTREEWECAVNAARAALLLHSARCYGLITGGPDVNVARCQELICEYARRPEALTPAPPSQPRPNVRTSRWGV